MHRIFINELFQISVDVILGESTVFEEIRWRFPNTTECPLSDCKLSCSSSFLALIHFTVHHATTAMICIICNKLFSVENPTKLIDHFKRHHPNEVPKLKTVMNNNSDLVWDLSRNDLSLIYSKETKI